MHLLALEPYFAGSHRAFLEGWRARSRHRFTLLTLPGHHWKWRMRHAAVTFADEIRARLAAGETWDALWASSMLDLATLVGLAPRGLARLPRVVYFHENQAAYPVRHADCRDVHFSLIQMNAALAADAVWFNSRFCRDSFTAELARLLAKMPDHRLPGAPGRIDAVSAVHHPGIDPLPPRAAARQPGPLRLVWAARWEHDKGPDDLLAALDRLDQAGTDFRLSLLGEQFRDSPPAFAEIQRRFADRLDHVGYLPRRSDYLAALQQADVFISTARHEFFGLSAAEAAHAGCFPLLPRRLAYPELFSDPDFFYDNAPAHLARRVRELADRLAAGNLWQGDPTRARRVADRFTWPRQALALDDALDDAAAR